MSIMDVSFTLDCYIYHTWLPILKTLINTIKVSAFLLHKILALFNTISIELTSLLHLKFKNVVSQF